MRLTPRRQRPQLGSTAEHRVMEYQSWSLATVYRDGFFVTVWHWPLTFWPLGQCMPTCTKFGVDSSSHFPVRVRTNRQTDATERTTHAGGYAGVGNDLSISYNVTLVKYCWTARHQTNGPHRRLVIKRWLTGHIGSFLQQTSSHDQQRSLKPGHATTTSD